MLFRFGNKFIKNVIIILHDAFKKTSHTLSVFTVPSSCFPFLNHDFHPRPLKLARAIVCTQVQLEFFSRIPYYCWCC